MSVRRGAPVLIRLNARRSSSPPLRSLSPRKAPRQWGETSVYSSKLEQGVDAPQEPERRHQVRSGRRQERTRRGIQFPAHHQNGSPCRCPLKVGQEMRLPGNWRKKAARHEPKVNYQPGQSTHFTSSAPIVMSQLTPRAGGRAAGNRWEPAGSGIESEKVGPVVTSRPPAGSSPAPASISGRLTSGPSNIKRTAAPFPYRDGCEKPVITGPRTISPWLGKPPAAGRGHNKHRHEKIHHRNHRNRRRCGARLRWIQVPPLQRHRLGRLLQVLHLRGRRRDVRFLLPPHYLPGSVAAPTARFRTVLGAHDRNPNGDSGKGQQGCRHCSCLLVLCRVENL